MLVVVNDTQLKRNCDEEALGAFLAFLEKYKDKITHFVFNGDILDFEEQSLYAKSPDQIGQTQEEIEAGRWLIEHISSRLPWQEKVFILGNHEDRWANFLRDQHNGIEHWIKTIGEMYGLSKNGWNQVKYGRGNFYRWHDRIFWHGHRSGAKANIPKLELEDAGVSVTTAHINRNMYFESIDALGHAKSGVTHGGFSRNNLPFMKKANTGWSQGFGIYFWEEGVGEQVYSVVMNHGNPRFIYDGHVFDGKGWAIPV